MISGCKVAISLAVNPGGPIGSEYEYCDIFEVEHSTDETN